MRFVAENGGHLPELQSRSRHLSFFVYGQIDVLLTLFGIGFTMLALFVLVLRKCFSLASFFFVPSKLKSD